MAYYWLIGWPQLRISGHADATHSSPPRGEWYALTSITHRDDAVNSSPQKPPATYTLIRGSMILDHIRTRFLGGDLYASIYGKSFWELVYSSVNQVLTDHQLWHSPFPVTLQRVFNTRLKNCRLLFSAVISEHFSKNRMIISAMAAEIWSLKNVQFLLGHHV